MVTAVWRGIKLGPFGFLPASPEVVVRGLDRRSLALVGATYVHTFRDSGTGPHLVSTLGEPEPLLSKLGTLHLVTHTPTFTRTTSFLPDYSKQP